MTRVSASVLVEVPVHTLTMGSLSRPSNARRFASTTSAPARFATEVFVAELNTTELDVAGIAANEFVADDLELDNGSASAFHVARRTARAGPDVAL